MRTLKFAAILLSVASGVGAACAQSQFPPPQPTIPAGTYNVTNYGAVGDGSTINTTAIQNAIAAAVASAAKGGTVEIPGPGTYLSGPLTMKSGINLQVDAGATLQMLPYASWPGTTTFINGSSLHDVEISGAGVIDGQGTDWWNAYNSNKISRPNFINFSGTTRILIQNITLQNPPTFHLMLKGNNANITIQGITINTPGAPGVAPNTDGMDLASTNVLVRNCSIGACILLINGGIDLAPAAVLNYLLGTNNAEAFFSGNLALGGTVNVIAGPGFGPGIYSILNYSGALSGTFPVLDVAPAGYTYNFDTNTPGVVKFDVGPSLSPVTLGLQSSAGQLTLSWPADHTGWRLQIQINAHNGLGTNWTTVPNSQTTNQIAVPVSATNGSLFLRLTYP